MSHEGIYNAVKSTKDHEEEQKNLRNLCNLWFPLFFFVAKNKRR
jgi:hypothetical protein